MDVCCIQNTKLSFLLKSSNFSYEVCQHLEEKNTDQSLGAPSVDGSSLQIV